MNKQQKEWFDYYLASGDDKRAVEIAYPDVDKANRASKASHLRARFATEIDQESRKLYGQLAPTMLNVIKTIALEGKQEAVRMKAASEWLSRAGHDAAQVLEIKEKQTHQQLQDKLKVLAANLPKEELEKLLSPQVAAELTKEEKDIGQQTQH